MVAREWVAQAAEQKAEVVLLPALMPDGYILTEELWNYAETLEELSTSWLLRTAKDFGIYLGFSFL